MTNCIFCAIVDDQAAAHKVWENKNYLAFLDIKPINPGHVIIIPKVHTSYAFELTNSLFTGLFNVARTLEPALKKVTHAERIGLALEGFGIDHAHLHVIPVHGVGDVDPKRAKSATEGELNEMSTKIQAAITLTS
jgi:histidine triad (HIT) family protein